MCDLAQAVEQAVASAEAVWESPDGAALFGDFTKSKIAAYQVGAREWEALILACREAGAADV